MTQTELQDQNQEQEPRSSRPLVLAGVFGAVLMGVALGVWARPAQPGESLAKPPAKPTPALQIVIDDAPAPLGRLLDVLPADMVPNAGGHETALQPAAPPAPLPVEPMAPRRPVTGLVKVAVADPAETPVLVLPVTPKPEAKPEPEPRPRPALKPVKAIKAEPPKAEKVRKTEARVAPAKPSKAEQLAAARAEKQRKADAAERLAAAKAARQEKAERAQLAAKAEKARATRLAQAQKAEKLEKAQLAKAQKAKAAKLARLEAEKVKAAKAEAKKPVRLATAAKPRPKVVRAEPKPTPKVQRAQAAPARPAARGTGPMRIARANTCASSDPGEAIVCADSRLGARDRQLQQAYRNAEAAGVPATALRRQQDRWLQARAAAAREAPWAVEDVYEARISELNDLSRDAREN